MAKDKNQDQYSELQFPLNGLYLATENETPPPNTTPVGSNVRTFETLTGRGRGGSRPGLKQYIPDQLIPGVKVQHLAVIIDPQSAALFGGFGDNSNAPGRNLDGGVGGYQPVRGHVQPGRLPFIDFARTLITITADDQEKSYGNTFTFAGTEFTQSGSVLNPVSSVTLTSSGSAATARVSGSPYAIRPSRPVGSNLQRYRFRYVNGAMTVIPAPLLWGPTQALVDLLAAYSDSMADIKMAVGGIRSFESGLTGFAGFDLIEPDNLANQKVYLIADIGHFYNDTFTTIQLTGPTVWDFYQWNQRQLPSVITTGGAHPSFTSGGAEPVDPTLGGYVPGDLYLQPAERYVSPFYGSQVTETPFGVLWVCYQNLDDIVPRWMPCIMPSASVPATCSFVFELPPSGLTFTDAVWTGVDGLIPSELEGDPADIITRLQEDHSSAVAMLVRLINTEREPFEATTVVSSTPVHGTGTMPSIGADAAYLHIAVLGNSYQPLASCTNGWFYNHVVTETGAYDNSDGIAAEIALYAATATTIGPWCDSMTTAQQEDSSYADDTGLLAEIVAFFGLVPN